MDRIQAMKLLLAVTEKGSFSAAARDMRVSLQTVSRRIAELEDHLGNQLLLRTTRSLKLTDAGIAYAAAARRIIEQVEEAEREAGGEFVTPRGELVITAPLYFGRLHVLPIVSEFLALYPEINVRLALGDRNVNLLDDQVDMAVRIGHLPDSGMIATRVGSMRGLVCASPRLLAGHGVPQTPQDLVRMPCITSDGPAPTTAWRFQDPEKQTVFEVPVQPRLVTTAEALTDAAVRSVGLARLLHYQAADGLRSNKLTVVLDRFEQEPFPVHILHAPRTQLPLKMRRFLDFAAPRLRQQVTHIGTA